MFTYYIISNIRFRLTNYGYLESESMKVGFDEDIKLEFHGVNLSSNGGLLVYRDLDHALGLFDSVSTSFSINAQVVISNMLCPLFCDNRYTAALRIMKK